MHCYPRYWKHSLLLRKDHFDAHQALTNNDTRVNLYWPKCIVMFETSLAITKTHKIKKGRKLNKTWSLKNFVRGQEKTKGFFLSNCRHSWTTDIADNGTHLRQYGNPMLVMAWPAAKLKNKCSCYEQMLNWKSSAGTTVAFWFEAWMLCPQPVFCKCFVIRNIKKIHF